MPDFADDLADRIDGTARLAAVSEASAKLRRGEREVIALCTAILRRAIVAGLARSRPASKTVSKDCRPGPGQG